MIDEENDVIPGKPKILIICNIGSLWGRSQDEAIHAAVTVSDLGFIPLFQFCRSVGGNIPLPQSYLAAIVDEVPDTGVTVWDSAGAKSHPKCTAFFTESARLISLKKHG